MGCLARDDSVRFEVSTIGNRLDRPDTFGVYTHTLNELV